MMFRVIAAASTNLFIPYFVFGPLETFKKRFCFENVTIKEFTENLSSFITYEIC
jgi:hypothetical protein